MAIDARYSLNMTAFLRSAVSTSPATMSMLAPADEGVKIDYIRQMKSLRKEDRIQQILTTPGNRAGLVHIFSAMGRVRSYEPRHGKRTGNTERRQPIKQCFSAIRSLFFSIAHNRAPRPVWTRRLSASSFRHSDQDPQLNEHGPFVPSGGHFVFFVVEPRSVALYGCEIATGLP